MHIIGRSGSSRCHWAHTTYRERHILPKLESFVQVTTRNQQRSHWEICNQPFDVDPKQDSAGTGFCVGKAVSPHTLLSTFAIRIKMRESASSHILQPFCSYSATSRPVCIVLLLNREPQRRSSWADLSMDIRRVRRKNLEAAWTKGAVSAELIPNSWVILRHVPVCYLSRLQMLTCCKDFNAVQAPRPCAEISE